MTAVWSDCNAKQAFGIAKCNFDQERKPHRLNLDVGDAVIILKETTHWYYGYKQKAKETRGIFPKTYVHLCEYSIVNGEFCIQRTDIVEEITKVLLEWGAIAKSYFLSTNPSFQKIRRKMNELNNNRAALISGNLPLDEVRKVKLLATAQIDTGNKILSLDMVVRDESGDILDTNAICTTELYEHHVHAVTRIEKANRLSSESGTTRSLNKYSHNILLHVNAFVCKFQEDADLLFTLFDGETHKPISENYVVKWSRTGIARDIEQIDNNRVLFTDLSRSDLNIAKMYLVCYAIRIGSMEVKDSADSKRTSMSIANSVLTAASRKHSQLSVSSNGSSGSTGEYILRRPFGVACKDLTPIISKSEDYRGNLDLPFIMCEKDTLDGTLRKLIANKDIGKIDSKMAVTIEVLRGDIKQIKEDFPRLVHSNVPVARKMGFPEVILPGDVRNDLYLTICSGEFAKTAKNVEVSVCVANEHGSLMPGVISMGAGHPPIDEYKSVVYYHEDKPKWQETFKIHVPIEDFKQCHLRFTLKHRSSNEQRDRQDKSFVLAYVRLMQANGTTITQGQHVLAVYKIDHKKYDKSEANCYMELPSTLAELQGTKPSNNAMTLLPKDQLTIGVNLCSTKLTQSVSLLGLLNWSAHKETLEQSLNALCTVPGEEVVKFLQDILDALFNILVENDHPEKYDQLVFMSIIHLIETVSELKYQHFLTVLDVYINESFSFTLAYTKLMDVLQKNIREAITPREKSADAEESAEVRRLYKTTRYLHYVMKFVIRSRVLYAEMNCNTDYVDFATRLQELMRMFIDMIGCPSNLLKSEGALLKNLHIIATDLMQVFDQVRLSVSIVEILEKFPPRRLTQSKMGCIKDFVETKLFSSPKCRAILLPVFCKHIKDHLESKEEGDTKTDIWQQEKNLSKAAKVLGQSKSQLHTRETTANKKIAECINIMNNILKLLYRTDVGATHNDIRDIMIILLRTVMKAAHSLDRDTGLVGKFFAIMLGILQRMDAQHYEYFVKDLHQRCELKDFVIEILLVFEELVSPHQKAVFPRDWMDMIMHQNTVILGALKHLSVVITDYFLCPFEKQIWSNFFQCSIAFLVQSPLQLNDFNDNKRQIVFARYRDIRKDTAMEIRKMWFQLGQHKPKFVPQLVEPILEMSMIPETELRRETIPIFFDMMQCEYYSSRLELESYGDTKYNNAHHKGNFTEFKTAMIEKLDILIGAGKGDAEYKQMFEEIMLERCAAHNTLNVDGTSFVQMVTRLMDKLLEYRFIIQDESKENRMACTFSLLQFYSEVDLKEMYIRYVYKLCALHMEFENYTEAAFTLKLHTELLRWTDTELSPQLRSYRHSLCRTHRDLKEALYFEILDYFDKGKQWECAIDMCKVLARQYEEEIYDYIKLAELLKRMAQFYEKILKELRHSSEYFRVCFYGRGFPRLLQNRVYIFRGKEYERHSDFCTRMLVQHPQAELMQTLEAPGEDITQSDAQYIQVNKVEPIMDAAFSKFHDKIISNEIVKYYTANNVQKFQFSRPFRDSSGGGDDVRNLWLERTELITRFPLPGILRWFPVVEAITFKISPLERAVEIMKDTNRDIRQLVILHKSDETLHINPLSMKLNGIVDPAVMGGFAKYEEAFLTDEYLEEHPDDKELIEELKELIATQIPLLEIAIMLHRQKAPDSLKALQEHLESCFSDMQQHVETRYGRKTCDLKIERDSVVMRRTNSFLPALFDSGCNRLSETSMGSSDSGLSKSTILPRPPTNSIKSTLASLSFNTRPSLGHSPSTKSSKNKDKTPAKRRSMKKDREALSFPSSQWYTPPLTTITSTPEKEINMSIGSLASASNSSLSGPKTPDPHVLTEELTPKRPLRSEKDKERRHSRPASIATPTASIKNFPNDTRSLSESSNRNSVETTDSTSEEDIRPPPLPAKTRDSTDFTSLSHNMDWTPNGYAMLSTQTSFTSNSSSTGTSTTMTKTSITNNTYEYLEATNFSLVGAVAASPDGNKPRPPTPPPKPSRHSKHIP
ncbi:dedicator of cytokinesis protein 1 isoform X1 [Drosophila subobscura]|uniref:dedicator of cytokinesis protein 1 isoform X1 n=1 Tax=Drosophila subobscura TaxID=7241 RepID=UPI00155B0D33|nr:dedicator of cytokinesis protein 1 isoform X1 [Drosophila subobscura]